MSCTCFLRCCETLRPNKRSSREFETDYIPHSRSESSEATWPHDFTEPRQETVAVGAATSPTSLNHLVWFLFLDVSPTSQNKLLVVIINTCLFAFFSLFFSSQTPEQQSYTKDSQGGFRRPGKPQISVSCPHVTFALALSPSARCWDDVAASPLRHSVQSAQGRGGGRGGRWGRLDEAHPKTKSIDL